MSSFVAFGPGFILLLAIENAVFWKDRHKRYVLVFLGPGNLKVVFTLLIKIIAFYMQVAIIEMRVSGLESLIQSILLRFC